MSADSMSDKYENSAAFGIIRTENRWPIWRARINLSWQQMIKGDGKSQPYHSLVFTQVDLISRLGNLLLRSGLLASKFVKSLDR